MSSPRASSAVVLLLVAFASSGCSSQRGAKVCTERACAAGASVRRALTAEAAGDGRHTFSIEADGKKVVCVLEQTSAKERTYAKCDAGASLALGPVMRSVPVTLPGTTIQGHGEEPVPGAFDWQLTVSGKPTSVRIQHLRGDKTVSDDTVKPVYKEISPNGPGCTPVCSMAEETIS